MEHFGVMWNVWPWNAPDSRREAGRGGFFGGAPGVCMAPLGERADTFFQCLRSHSLPVLGTDQSSGSATAAQLGLALLCPRYVCLHCRGAQEQGSTRVIWQGSLPYRWGTVRDASDKMS